MVRLLIPKFVPGKSEKYNMHGQHSRYDKALIPQVLHSPYARVAFVRHPFTHLRSWLYAGGLVRSLPLKGPDPMEDFLLNLRHYRNKPGVSRVRNPIASTFRIGRDLEENSTEFQDSLRDIDRTFIVGLTEYYTESLVLLRRRLCWTLRDVIYVPLRRTASYKGPHKEPMDYKGKKLWKLACAWSNLDCKIHDYFNQSFWRAVGKEGPEFQDEVVHLNKVLTKTYDYCTSVYRQLKGNVERVAELHDALPPLTITGSKWNERFTLGVVDCALMRADDITSEILSFYIQNKAECESVRRHKKHECKINWPTTDDLCGTICRSTNDTMTMVLNFLTGKGVYVWH